LNRYAEVRWAEDATRLTMELPRLSELQSVPRVVIDAHAALLPVVEDSTGPLQAIGVPLVDHGTARGLVLIRAPVSEIDSLSSWLETRPVAPLLPRSPASKVGSVGAYDIERSAWQHYLSGVVWYLRGNVARAADEWGLTLKLSPEFGDAKAGLARLKR